MRRWLRFRVSSLLWAVVCCAIALSWWRDRQNLLAKLYEADLLEQADAVALEPRSTYSIGPVGPLAEMLAPDEQYDVVPVARLGRSTASRFIGRPNGNVDEMRMLEVSEEELATLVKMLDDNEAGTRAQAAGTLARCAYSQFVLSAVPALAHALSDEDATVRCQAAFALGAMGVAASPAASALKEAWRRETDPQRAEYFLEVLHWVDAEGPDAGPLIERLEENDPKLQTRAAQMLAPLGRDRAKDAVPRLLLLIHAEDAAVREAAIHALGSLARREEAVAPLLDVFQHTGSEETRIAAAEALMRITKRDPPRLRP